MPWKRKTSTRNLTKKTQSRESVQETKLHYEIERVEIQYCTKLYKYKENVRLEIEQKGVKLFTTSLERKLETT